MKRLICFTGKVNMTAKISKLEDEKRRREELAAFCRHVSAVLEMFSFSLEQLNPASRRKALRHVRKEVDRLFSL
jgi:hypothetical protein